VCARDCVCVLCGCARAWSALLLTTIEQLWETETMHSAAIPTPCQPKPETLNPKDQLHDSWLGGTGFGVSARVLASVMNCMGSSAVSSSFSSPAAPELGNPFPSTTRPPVLHMPNAAAGERDRALSTVRAHAYYCTNTRVSNVLLTTVSAPPVPQEVLLLRYLLGLAALGRIPPRPWHLEAAPAAVANAQRGRRVDVL
jgi:hypothetical protein